MITIVHLAWDNCNYNVAKRELWLVTQVTFIKTPVNDISRAISAERAGDLFLKQAAMLHNFIGDTVYWPRYYSKRRIAVQTLP